MKNVVIIILSAILLISATAVTTTQVVQPKQPIDVRILSGNFCGESNDSVTKKINAWGQAGYIVKAFSLTNCVYAIILEKY